MFQLEKQIVLKNAGRVHDIVVTWIAFYLSFIATLGYDRIFIVSGVHDKALLYAAISGLVYYAVSLNRGSWRYASIPDVIAILKGAFLSAGIFTIVLFMLSRAQNLPRSIPVLTFIFTVFGLSASRLIYRLLKEQGLFSSSARKLRRAPARNVVLLGVNANSESFVRSVRRSELSAIRIVGFLDDRTDRRLKIQGVPVLGTYNMAEEVLVKLHGKGIIVSELIVTDTNVPSSEISELLSSATQLGVKLSRIPDLANTAELESNALVTKKFDITDLLGRKEFLLDSAVVETLIKGKTVLVTGAGGSIGSELVRQIAQFNAQSIVLLDSSEFLLYQIDLELREAHSTKNVETYLVDVRDREKVFKTISNIRPDVIFHAAALKHVPLMEKNKIECLKTNVFGTRNLADAAVEYKVNTFVLISTDKAVNPTSLMGASKRAAEIYCQSRDIANTGTRFKTVRFGNVLGSNGSVVPRFQKQIEQGGPVTVTHPDITRYFMTIPEAVRLVLQASAEGLKEGAGRGRILVLDMGKPIRIVEMARKMIELAGFRPDIDIKIEYTGLRPGEKLYEELLDKAEHENGHSENGYFSASPRHVPESVIGSALVKMTSAIEAANETSAVTQLKKMVPEYKDSATN